MVTIKAANVTIKNSIIRGRALTGNAALVNNMGNFANLNVIDTELFPSIPSVYVQGFYGSNATFTRVNIHGIVDGVHITGSNVSVQKSWIHDNLHYLVDPSQGGTPTHDDTIQIQIGDNIVINGNTLTGAHNAAVMITQDSGHVSNVTFTNNFADNGACTINVAQKTFGPIVGMTVTDNKFGRNTTNANCAVISPTTTVITMARNYYVPDNALVTVKRG
ncbi:hypothetical protein JF66_22135 [Cryobacterium sp. MLB-32]|nr:hypothetical protein JF66_22135 [Cryobacterium sp. MLB-32]